MKRNLQTLIVFAVLMFHTPLAAQSLVDRVSQPLSPAEERYRAANGELSLVSSITLYANPAFTEWHHRSDTARHRTTAIVYSGMAGADGKGDFMPYEGDGATDYRVGAYGEYATAHSGTLSGLIQYAQGKHRNIGWSAMRQPERYLPYISTDSCGGDYKYDSYYAEGNYGLTLGRWTLGVKGSFYGEQAFRLTDPRALNSTAWMRFHVGAGRRAGRHLLLADAGYGRNKQHMQLRYWRPGQQDRFFVCYGFGLYDNRQSAVSFGKSRMYYVDELNARLQYLSPQELPLQVHVSAGYAYAHMKTEESDIYDLYELRTHSFSSLLRLTCQPVGSLWLLELAVIGQAQARKGYENIIEEYLIDKENNIYDFRTIDTQQNYSRNEHRMMAAFGVTRRLGNFEAGLQGGLTAEGYDEQYKDGDYRIRVHTLTPHARCTLAWQGEQDGINLSLLYARQTVGTHDYEVDIQNGQIPHLDFQHAFAPYAFRAATLDKLVAGVTWQHRFEKLSVGLSGKLYIADGHRKEDVGYSGTIGFPSTAPMLSAAPDEHQERWGNITAFITF